MRNLRRAAEAIDGGARGELRAKGGLNSGIEKLRVSFPTELRNKFFPGDAAVGGAAGQPGKGTARADDRFAEPSGGFAIAKFQAIGYKTFGAEIFGHRA